MKLLIIQLHDPPVNFFISGPNIILNALFSDTLNLCFCLIRDKVLQPYKPTNKIIVFHVVIFMFYIGNGKTNRS
jgi:hypothetical protein